MDERYQQLYESWMNFIKSGEVNENILRPIIIESWKRCIEYDIDPYKRNFELPIDPNLLRERNEYLIKIIRPFMEMIFNFVKESGFLVLLTDKEGYVLDLIGDKEITQIAKNNHLVLGANRKEKTVGTNAIGLSLIKKEPVQIYGPEHFNYYHHAWTCSAAPIKNPKGKVLCVLNMSGHYSLVHKHTLGMVASAARAIERELSLEKAHQKIFLAHEYLKAVIDSFHEGVLALNRSNKIIYINSKAANILGGNGGKTIGKKINEILGTGIGTPEINNSGLVDNEIYIRKGNLKNCLLVTTMPIKQNEENLGVVIILREKRKVHNLVHRIVGATANFYFEDIIGKSQPLRDCINLAKAFANTDSKILIEGESGTGKELFAQSIHNHSKRREGPFIAVNCSAIPKELIESELFGYEGGAFTGAKAKGKPGKFELAEGGTLFLDEISSMSLDTQAKLLRVLQENQLVRIGGINVIPLNVKILAASNKKFEELIKDGFFREDLYYRLSVVTINIPSLRDRKGDLPILIERLSNKICNKLDIGNVSFSQEVIDLLESYDWPGNVRELENVLERAIVLSKGGEINVDLLPEIITNVKDFDKAIIRKHYHARNGKLFEHLKIQAINKALEVTNGNVSKAAKLLGVSRNTIYNSMKKG